MLRPLQSLGAAASGPAALRGGSLQQVGLSPLRRNEDRYQHHHHGHGHFQKWRDTTAGRGGVGPFGSVSASYSSASPRRVSPGGVIATGGLSSGKTPLVRASSPFSFQLASCSVLALGHGGLNTEKDAL